MTWGELAGWSTEGVVELPPQSLDPLSPEAANQLWRIALPLAKMLSLVVCTDIEVPDSQEPQLVLTMWPGLSVTIRLYIFVKSVKLVEAAM